MILDTEAEVGITQQSPAGSCSLIVQRPLARSQTDSDTRARAIVVSSRGPGSPWMRSPAATDVAALPRGDPRQKIGPEEIREQGGAAHAAQSSEALTGSDAQASALWREKFRARMRSLATGQGLQCPSPASAAPVDCGDDRREVGLDSSSEARAAFVAALQG